VDRKNKRCKDILLFATITIAAFLLFFIVGKNIIDDTKLNSALEEVPEYYTTFFSESVSSHLNELMVYVKENEKTMTQETVDEYAKELQEVIKSYTVTDVPHVYITASNEELYDREYHSSSIAIAPVEGGESEEIIDFSAKIKIRGNSTAEVAKKSYTIKFSNKQDVLGMGAAKKWILSANALDRSLMRNKLVFDFAATIGLAYTPDSTFADVWLNGIFIGNYLLSESIEVAPTRVDIDTEQGDFLIEREAERVSAGTTYFTTPIYGYRFGVNEPEDITEEQLEELTGFIEKVEKAIEARDWELFTSLIDEKSYIDYYILSELFKEVDIDYSSTRFYIKNGKLYAGPTWDYDLSAGNADGDFYYDYNYHESFGPDSSYIGLWCNVNFYSYCYEFQEFRDALGVRYNELQEVIVNLYKDNPLGINQIDSLMEKYGKSFDRNYTTAGWTLRKDYILPRISEPTYEQNVEYLRVWLEKRNEFLLDSIK